MTNYTRRDWYMMNLGFSIGGAILGAMMQSLSLVLWNVFWIGITMYQIGTLEK